MSDPTPLEPSSDLDQLPVGTWTDLDAVGDAIEDQLLADARRCPAARTPLGVNVYQRAAVDQLLRDRRASCRLGLLAMAQGIFDGPLADLYAADILDTNGPEHIRIRTLVSRSLTPKQVERHRPRIRAVVSELLDRIEAGVVVEAMGTFIDELPVRIVCDLLGIPRAEVDDVHRWLRVLPAMLSMDAADHEAELLEAYSRLHEMARRHLADRQDRPRDDLTTAIALAEEDGDRLTAEEAERFWVGLLNAGQETTRNVLGRGLLLLADHPDQWALLHADPDGLAANATEEILRLAPNTPIITPRLADEDLELTLDGRSVTIPGGTVLYPVHTAANRDSRVYGIDADRPDVRRDQPAPHLTFGAGPHYCAGASLARAEIAEALRGLAARFGSFEVVDEPTWRSGGGMMSLDRLQVRFAR